jgi:hypothetical protein
LSHDTRTDTYIYNTFNLSWKPALSIYTHLSMYLNTAGTLRTIQLLLSLSTSAPYQVDVHACNDLTVYVHMHCHSLCDLSLSLSPVLPVTANHVNSCTEMLGSSTESPWKQCTVPPHRNSVENGLMNPSLPVVVMTHIDTHGHISSMRTGIPCESHAKKFLR